MPWPMIRGRRFRLPISATMTIRAPEGDDGILNLFPNPPEDRQDQGRDQVADPDFRELQEVDPDGHDEESPRRGDRVENRWGLEETSRDARSVRLPDGEDRKGGKRTPGPSVEARARDATPSRRDLMERSWISRHAVLDGTDDDHGPRHVEQGGGDEALHKR